MVLPIRLRFSVRKTGVHEEAPSESSNGSGSSSTRTSPKYKKKAWIEKMKENPERWSHFKEAEACRQRARRAKRTETQKQRDQETSKLRQRRFVKKHKGKEKKQQQVTKAKVLTRSDKIRNADYNRQKKKESRARRNPQQIRREREKDAKRKREKRALEKKARKGKQETTPQSGASSGFSSSASRRKALSRLWHHVPKDAEKFADVVEDLVSGSRTTPKKQDALCKRGLDIASNRTLLLMKESVQRNLQVLKRKNDTSSRNQRRLLMAAHLISKKYRKQKALAKELDVRPAYLSKLSTTIGEHPNNSLAKKKKVPTATLR